MLELGLGLAPTQTINKTQTPDSYDPNGGVLGPTPCKYMFLFTRPLLYVPSVDMIAKRLKESR